MSDGDRAILTLAVLAGLYDAWAITTGAETISAAVHKHRRWMRPVRIFLALHFEHAIPDHLDPLRRWWR